MNEQNDSASEGVSEAAPELSPCPLCDVDRPQLSTNERHNYVIFCRACGIELEENDHEGDVALIARWNARVHQPEQNLEDKNSVSPKPKAPSHSTSRILKDISLTLAEIRERRAKITAPWSLSVPSIEIGYTNGAILWDGEGCNFGEIAPNDNDYEACDFAGDNYQNSNATFAVNAPTDIDYLLNLVDELRNRT